MAVPTQMTAHTLDAKKGWPRPNALDFSAVFDPTQLGTLQGLGVEAYAGRCVHLTATGFKYGCDANKMPMFLINGSDHPDVANSGGSGANAWVPVLPAGVLTALVATGAYELETTELVSGQTYAINEMLTSPLTATDAGGRLSRLFNKDADAGVGVVSRAKHKNAHGVDCITFWPVYSPFRTTQA